MSTVLRRARRQKQKVDSKTDGLWYIQNNYVLIEATIVNEKTKSGLHLDTSFDKGKHFSVTGHIIDICDRLVFHGHEIEALRKRYRNGGVPLNQRGHLMDLNTNSLAYDTKIEVKVYDQAYFHFLALDESSRLGLQIGPTWYLMPYDKLYAVRRGDQIIPVNGKVLVTPNKKAKMHDDLTIEWAKDDISGEGVIKYLGSPLKGYLGYPGIVDHDDLAVGDHIFFNRNHMKKLEYEYHSTMEELYVMNRKEVFAVKR